MPQEQPREFGNREEELTRLVREGVQPASVQDRLRVGVDKLTGKAPLGIDARNKTARKVIGAGGELLGVLKYGFVGAVLVLLGPLFVWAGFFNTFQWKMVALGVGIVALGVLSLRAAYHAWRNLRAISKA